MKQMLKKFFVYLVLVSIFCFILFFLFKKYDFGWNTINWIISNKYYIFVLCLSLAICLSIYWNEKPKSKFILYFIICINVLYLLFLFFVWNIWLSWGEWLLILAFLILWFLWIYIRGWLGYTIIIISLIWSLIILFLWFIPLFEKWPDFQWFEKKFAERILVYSNVYLNENNAQIVKDNKVYPIYEWLNTYDFKIKNTPSQIVFQSDNLYQNMYCFVVFKWWSFVEILPQSAITISDNFEIEVLTWIVKYYGDLNSFSFVWWNVTQETSDNVINIVSNRYYDSLKLYLKTELWSNILYNKSVLKVSKKTLMILSKIFPWKYDKNLENLQEYVDVFWVNIDDSEKYDGEISTKSVLDSVWWGVKKWVDMVD